MITPIVIISILYSYASYALALTGNPSLHGTNPLNPSLGIRVWKNTTEPQMTNTFADTAARPTSQVRISVSPFLGPVMTTCSLTSYTTKTILSSSVNDVLPTTRYAVLVDSFDLGPLETANAVILPLEEHVTVFLITGAAEGLHVLDADGSTVCALTPPPLPLIPVRPTTTTTSFDVVMSTMACVETASLIPQSFEIKPTLSESGMSESTSTTTRRTTSTVTKTITTTTQCSGSNTEGQATSSLGDSSSMGSLSSSGMIPISSTAASASSDHGSTAADGQLLHTQANHNDRNPTLWR